MSEIAVTVIKVLYLALLWLFILSAVSVIRSDLFGRTVPTPDQPRPQPLEEPPPPPKKTRRPRGQPHRLTIAQGPQAGQSADLAAGVIMIGRGSDCQLMLGRRLRLHPARPGRAGRAGPVRRGSRLHQRHATSTASGSPPRRRISMQDTIRIGKTVLRLET